MKIDFDKYHNLALEAKEKLRLKDIEEKKEKDIVAEETERIRVEKLKLKIKEYFDKLPELCEEASSRGQLYCTLFTVDGERRYNMEKCELLNGLIEYAEENNIPYSIDEEYMHDEGYNDNDAYLPPRDYYWTKFMVKF